jgi:hypothetical protein
MKRIASLLLAAIALSGSLAAQSDEAVSAQPMTVGAELDVLPFATGGWYGSIWAGGGGTRLRAVASRIHVPAFATPEGFQNQSITAVAALCDVFPAGSFERWWIGGGLEYWSGSVEESGSGLEGQYHSYLLTVGTGYVWKVAGNFYLNPWAAAHVVVAGSRDVPVGSSTFSPKTLTGEVSLKVGWHF